MDSEEGMEGKIACYARVSDVSQNSKGVDGKSSLERQIGRLLSEVSGREGVGTADIGLYKDVASSFGDRPGLNAMVDEIISGRVRRVYCLYLDRLSRVPALTRLVEHVCRRFGVEIIPLDVEDCETQEVWQKELLGYITVWCNRQSAAKSIAVTRKEVSGECVNRMIALRQKGWTAKRVWRQLVGEGFKMETGVGEVSELSYQKVRQLLDANGTETALSMVVGGDHKVEETCKAFISERVRKEEGGRLSVKEVYPVYEAFCQDRGLEPQPKNVLGRNMVASLGKHHTKYAGERMWVGYSII